MRGEQSPLLKKKRDKTVNKLTCIKKNLNEFIIIISVLFMINWKICQNVEMEREGPKQLYVQYDACQLLELLLSIFFFCYKSSFRWDWT